MKWIKSYITGRTSYVSIGSEDSAMSTVEFIVPQGSVLGPLFYLLYINKMGLIIKDNICLNLCHQNRRKLFRSNCKECGNLPIFADDSLYLVTGKDWIKNQERIFMAQRLPERKRPRGKQGENECHGFFLLNKRGEEQGNTYRAHGNCTRRRKHVRQTYIWLSLL